MRTLAMAKWKPAWTGLLALTLALGGAAAARSQPALPELKSFYQDFRGSKTPEAPLAVFGTKADLVARPEEKGLHIKVEANPGQTDRIGILLPARFRGDFELTAGYEIARVEQPTQGNGVGVCLVADLDSPAEEYLEMLRFARVTEGHVYGCVRRTAEAGKARYEQQWFPTLSKAGQLRLTRKGAELIFAAREGGAEQFTELERLNCGREDVKLVRFAVFLGHAPNSVDVYLKDLRLGPPGAAPVVAIDPAEPVAAPAVAAPRRRIYLVLGALLLMMLVLAASGIYFALRRRRNADDTTVN